MAKVSNTDKKYYQSRVFRTTPPFSIQDRGSSTLSLMQKGGNMVDLYNSFIDVEIELKPIIEKS
jgi:hypothetical protein